MPAMTDEQIATPAGCKSAGSRLPPLLSSRAAALVFWQRGDLLFALNHFASHPGIMQAMTDEQIAAPAKYKSAGSRLPPLLSSRDSYIQPGAVLDGKMTIMSLVDSYIPPGAALDEEMT